MAQNKRISDLNPLVVSADNDLFAIVDTSSSETKKINAGDLFANPRPIGTTVPNTGKFSALTLVNPINEFSVDGTLLGNSDTAVPTEKAVKTYVDAAVGNAVKLNILNISSDSTAEAGDVLIVNTLSGDINIELVPNGQGKIIIYKSQGGNDVIITPAPGSFLDNGIIPTTLTVNIESLEVVCDGINFYTI
jgi:hypothetical protein